MDGVTKHRSSRIVALALALVVAFGAGSALVAFGEDEGLTIYACLSPGGQLSAVTTDGQPECKGNITPISWNQQGPPGEDGNDGAPGTNGENGMDGSSLGYAHVTILNLLDTDRSKNVGENNFTRSPDFTGIYCFYNLPFDANVAVASPHMLSNTAATVTTQNVVGCPAETQWVVRTFSTVDNERVDVPFQVVFH